jgi:hypothetical protein
MPSYPKFPLWSALLIAAVLLGVLPACPAAAARWYVDPGGSGGGSSWEAASPDLAAVLKKAGPGDEIWVAEGVYKPAYDISGEKVDGNTRTFALKSAIKLYGGFPPGGAPNLEDRNAKAFPSVLDGDGAYHTVYAKNLAEEITLSGFTITGGNAAGDGEVNLRGGGLYCYKTPIRLEECVIRNNSANMGGGGACVTSSEITLLRCSFLNNTAAGGWGGGLLLEDSSAEIEGCLFMENSVSGSLATQAGGAVSIFKTALATIKNCSFINNRAHSETSSATGGGLYFYGGGSAELQNCTFSGNESRAPGAMDKEGNGGAVYIKGSKSSLAMVNCTVSGNSAKNRGGALYLGEGTVTAVNCIIYGNQGTEEIRTAVSNALYIYSSLLPAGRVSGTKITLNDITYSDPLLGELSGGDGFLFWVPSQESPVIGAGLPPGEHQLNGNTITVPAQDQRGFPRPSEGCTDLGACELQHYKLELSTSGDGAGLIEITPEGEMFIEGAEVTVTAVPDENSEFGGWTGEISGEDKTASIFMDGHKAVGAVFILKHFKISTSAGEGGTISPSSTVEWGGSAEVHIAPDSGYTISDVIIDGISAGPLESYTFSDVRADHSLRALFSPSGGSPNDPVDPKDPDDPDGPENPGGSDDPDGPDGPSDPGGPDDPEGPDKKEYENSYGRVVIRRESPALDLVLSGEPSIQFPEGLSASSFRRIAPKDVRTLFLEPQSFAEGAGARSAPRSRLIGISFDIGADLQNLMGIVAADIEIFVPVSLLSSYSLGEIEKDLQVMSLEEAFLRHVTIVPSFSGEDGVLNDRDDSNYLDHFSVVRDGERFQVAVRFILADADRKAAPIVQTACSGADCRFFAFDGVVDGYFRGLITLLEKDGVPPSPAPPSASASNGGCSFSDFRGLVLLIALPVLLLTKRRR